MFAFKVLQRTDAETSGVYLTAIKKSQFDGTRGPQQQTSSGVGCHPLLLYL